MLPAEPKKDSYVFILTLCVLRTENEKQCTLKLEGRQCTRQVWVWHWNQNFSRCSLGDTRREELSYT